MVLLLRRELFALQEQLPEFTAAFHRLATKSEAWQMF